MLLMTGGLVILGFLFLALLFRSAIVGDLAPVANAQRPLPHLEPVLLAVLEERPPGHVLHHEVGQAVVRGAAVEQTGDARVPQRGQEIKKVGGFAVGDRVFHQKFGYGTVRAVEDNKLAIDFEHAGDKKVMDAFVERA